MTAIDEMLTMLPDSPSSMSVRANSRHVITTYRTLYEIKRSNIAMSNTAARW